MQADGEKRDGVTVGVDVGGTKVAVLVTRDSDTVVNRARLATDTGSGDAAAQGIAAAIRAALEGTDYGVQDIRAIGVATPGQIDVENGIVTFAANIPWRMYPLRDRLKEALGLGADVPVVVDNDANVAALGEQVYGAGRGSKDMIYMTLGTGIGGGVIINGRVFHGGLGFAGEIGHIILLADGPLCGCGQHGCLEVLAAGPAILRYARESLKQGQQSALSGQEGQLTGVAVAQAAEAGDPVAKAAFEKAGHYLGLGILSIFRAFDPQTLVIGGGLAAVGDLLLEPARKTIDAGSSGNLAYVNNLLRMSTLGEDAGVWGAVALAAQASER